MRRYAKREEKTKDFPDRFSDKCRKWYVWHWFSDEFWKKIIHTIFGYFTIVSFKLMLVTTSGWWVYDGDSYISNLSPTKSDCNVRHQHANKWNRKLFLVSTLSSNFAFIITCNPTYASEFLLIPLFIYLGPDFSVRKYVLCLRNWNMCWYLIILGEVNVHMHQYRDL